MHLHFRKADTPQSHPRKKECAFAATWDLNLHRGLVPTFYLKAASVPRATYTQTNTGQVFHVTCRIKHASFADEHGTKASCARRRMQCYTLCCATRYLIQVDPSMPTPCVHRIPEESAHIEIVFSIDAMARPNLKTSNLIVQQR